VSSFRISDLDDDIFYEREDVVMTCKVETGAWMTTVAL